MLYCWYKVQTIQLTENVALPSEQNSENIL